MSAKIETIPECSVAYIRKTGAYNKENCEIALNELADWAGPKGFCKNGKIITIYLDDPETTDPDECRLDACITVPKDTKAEANSQVKIQIIPQGKYAILNYELAEKEFTSAWQEAFKYLFENNLECDERPHFETYYNDPKDHPENKVVVDICIPIK